MLGRELCPCGEAHSLADCLRTHGACRWGRPAARLIVRSEKEDAAGAFADTLAGAFKEALKRVAGVRLLGPAECPVFRLNNFYRYHFQLQSDSSAKLHDVLRTVLAVAKVPSGVEFQVDIDPYSML